MCLSLNTGAGEVNQLLSLVSDASAKARVPTSCVIKGHALHWPAVASAMEADGWQGGRPSMNETVFLCQDISDRDDTSLAANTVACMSSKGVQPDQNNQHTSQEKVAVLLQGHASPSKGHWQIS